MPIFLDQLDCMAMGERAGWRTKGSLGHMELKQYCLVWLQGFQNSYIGNAWTNVSSQTNSRSKDLLNPTSGNLPHGKSQSYIQEGWSHEARPTRFITAHIATLKRSIRAF